VSASLGGSHREARSRALTVKTAPARFEKAGDPLAPVPPGRIDGAATLRKLEHRAPANR